MTLPSAGIGANGPDVLNVKGRVIDVRTAEIKANAYPQYKKLRFGKSLPQSLSGRNYAVSLREFRGPEAVCSESPTDLILAYNGKLEDSSWSPTGEYFNLNNHRYHIYRTRYTDVGSWMELPAPLKDSASVMLFSDRQIKVSNTADVPGTVITKVAKLRKTHITNPNIIILPDGSYLAGCSGVEKQKVASLFRSTDKGLTWEKWSDLKTYINFFTLFLYQGDLYIIGTLTPEGDIVIARSSDNGKTWTEPDENQGVLYQGRYHTAPTPVVEHNGRIWRAFETNDKNEPRKALVISAKIGSDLLNPYSWNMSKFMSYSEEWPTKGGDGKFRQWIEGNVVVTPDGSLCNLLRVDEWEVGCTAAMIHIDSHRKLSFDPSKDIIEMPGGGKKFTVRYDEKSGKYWSLVSPADLKYRHITHIGTYAEGVHCGNLRNVLTLISSEDLREWKTERMLIESDNPFFDGFQYVDWRFEGDDIIAVIRVAMEEERGLPNRQHDANMLVFKRVEDFRSPGDYKADIITTLNR